MVDGDIPLVRKTQVVSEYGEPLTWQKGETLQAGGPYDLCRCGHSQALPFCDCTHADIGFDGTEAADTRSTTERQVTYPGSTKIVVRRDHAICTDAGFCGTRYAEIDELVGQTADTQVRSLVMAMIERCPSGSLTYALAEGEPDIEPDLPQEIAVTTEITSDGPIAGPLWVTGGIPIERADGQPLETRNRVTLCCCGRSKTKPLCDGAHRTPGGHAGHGAT
jgi:CDGSH-type Zn-finger protein